MPYKVTFFFESAQPAKKYASSSLGWTETWYDLSTISTVDQVLSAGYIENYITLRRACMNEIYRIAWVRVSDDANPRLYKIKAIDGGFGTCKSTTGPNGKIEGQVQCALLVDCAKLPDVGTTPPDHTHHRKFLMRALPADVINGNVVELKGANWGNIYSFLVWLLGNESGSALNPAALPPGIAVNQRLGLKYQDPNHTDFTAAAATALTVGDPHTFTLADAVTGNVGSTYTFRNFPDSSRDLNRNWRVLQKFTGPPASTVFGRTHRAIQSATYTPPGTGKLRLVFPKYALFDQFTIIGLRSRKTGRLFRQLRGRSSNR